MPTPRTPPGKGTQIPLDRPDDWFRCSRCVIEYPATRGQRPTCPLCRAEIKTEQMREALKVATSRLELLEKRARTLDSQVSIQSAFRSALDLLDEGDRVFLKTVLYQWRVDRSVTLKVIHAGESGQKRRASGFLAEWRRGDPEARECSSIGGRAVAGYFEEAQNTVGSAQAMAILLRAAQHLLPGEMA